MIVKLLPEHQLKKEAAKARHAESPLVKMSNCWKSHAEAQLFYVRM